MRKHWACERDLPRMIQLVGQRNEEEEEEDSELTLW